MRSVEEQSKVLLVFTRIIVGTLALAIVERGVYPPLATISIICLSFSVETLGLVVCVLAASPYVTVFGPCLEKIIIRITTTTVPNIIRKPFLFICL